MSDFFEVFPVLQTSRLDLVELSHEHVPDLFKLFTDPRVTEFYNVIPLKEEADAEKIIEILTGRYRERSGIRWGIMIKGDNKVIGNLGFNSFTRGHRSVIGYSLMYDYWNKGIITEALSAIIDLGFDQLQVNRIEAEVMPGNVASERVLTKLGFRYEGLLREWMLWEGKHYDINMYSLLKGSRKSRESE